MDRHKRNRKPSVVEERCPAVPFQCLEAGESFGSFKPSRRLLFTRVAEEYNQFAQAESGCPLTFLDCLEPFWCDPDFIVFVNRIYDGDAEQRALQQSPLRLRRWECFVIVCTEKV